MRGNNFHFVELRHLLELLGSDTVVLVFSNTYGFDQFVLIAANLASMVYAARLEAEDQH